ncbi:Cys-tRNA(Pro) deacylase [Crassaminicella thermophila]|uniref:Cys-tRNA(Pro)/Cys-tRNA(Cys) deacylase n=1 Tax=Crassaminicella thermophila TaxID=2599308 RepID=A0A5C0SDT9_CRATE|nr:Cys-tRNA(Pro) deacylase [Crassaminicella thermophila]QEK11424.1 Cys-tRNA(Pro) deacylase [Crassaminicella thermophila]
MGKVKKTNAMRILDKENINYTIITYDSKDGKIDGISVAEKIKKHPKYVYKTLVTKGNSKEIYVFIIPVLKELDLKKAAIAVKEKKIEMIPVKDIFKTTGYIKGGCSPIGMRKNYKIFIDSSASQIDSIIVSGGKIGVQIELSVVQLKEVVNGEMVEVVK